MLSEVFNVETEGSNEGAKLYTYIQDVNGGLGWKERPLILICPGGGYELTSDREADP